MEKWKNRGLWLVGLVLLQVVCAFWYARWDLTEEKRYSLSDATQSLLQNLKDDVVIRVYLTGEQLPGGFKRLERAIAEQLEEYEALAGRRITYEFIDIQAQSDPEKRKSMMEELIQKGMQPTQIFDTKGGNRVETLLFPYATVWQNNQEMIVLLLKGNQTLSAQERLNQSYENIEFAFASAIRQLQTVEKKKIGLLSEFTSKSPDYFAGMITTLQKYYDVYILDAKASVTFDGLDALLVPKPERRLDDSTKWKIDHFVASGGKALFFVDGQQVDSLGLQGTFAQPIDTGLEDLFFHWGIRLNTDLVKDAGSAQAIPMVVGSVGSRPTIQPVPFRFFPLINQFGPSVITRNLDRVSTRFPSSLTEVNSVSGLKKTPLLLTTPYTKTLQAPALVSFDESRETPDYSDYTGGVRTIAYLLEGRAGSLYQNRLLPSDPRQALYTETSGETQLILVADGDLIVNEVDPKTGNPMPLGWDRLTNQTLGNMDFVLNAVDYLVDQNGVITARNKEVKIRPLDKKKIQDNRTLWQVGLVGGPVLLLILLGVIWNWRIQKKYRQGWA